MRYLDHLDFTVKIQELRPNGYSVVRDSQRSSGRVRKQQRHLSLVMDQTRGDLGVLRRGCGRVCHTVGRR